MGPGMGCPTIVQIGEFCPLLSPSRVDGVLRAEGKLLHLGFGRCAWGSQAGACTGGLVRTLTALNQDLEGSFPTEIENQHCHALLSSIGTQRLCAMFC